MGIIEALSIGTLYQNIAFYTFLIFLAVLNFDLLKHSAKHKTVSAPYSNQ